MPKRTGMYAKCYKIFRNQPDLTNKQVAEILSVDIRVATNARHEWKMKQAKSKPKSIPEPVDLPPDVDVDFIKNIEALVGGYRQLKKDNEQLQAAVRRWQATAGKLNEDVAILIGRE